MDVRLLHVMHDDRHNDRVVKAFEGALPGRSEYVSLGYRKNRLRLIGSENVTLASVRAIKKLLATRDYDIVIFHALNPMKAGILRSVPSSAKVVWIGWGFDYYNSLLKARFSYPEGMLEPLTIEELSSCGMMGGIAKQSKNLVGTCKRLMLGEWYTKYDYRKVDVFTPVFKREWELATHLNQWFRPRYLEWNYSTVRPMPFGREVEKKNILIGNSATETNNHFDVMKKVADSSRKMEYEKVICPLSYGESHVREKVIEKGRYYFGKKFNPLVDLVIKDEYISMLAGCHTFFMNHIRQQAVGNINAGFLAGAKVVLNPRSIMVDEFRDRGFRFSTIDDFYSSELGAADIAWNDNAMQTMWFRNSSPAKVVSFVENTLDL